MVNCSSCKMMYMIAVVATFTLVHAGEVTTSASHVIPTTTPCIATREFLNELREMLKSEQEPTTSGAEGGMFTRWGRRDCPTGNELVYSGYVGGSDWKIHGGPASLLCLPKEPLYGNYTSGGQGGSYIYGTEYESQQTSPNVKPLDDHDIICAVCRSRRHRTTIMVPARNECYAGWKLEYFGYLMGGGNSFGPGDYICVDDKAEARVGSRESKMAQAMYLVESVCGALPCPPYHNYWELTCVVCSK